MSTDFLSQLEVSRNKLGEGGFGKVYSGWLPVQGSVAVKRVKRRFFDSDDEFEQRKRDLLGEAQRLKDAENDHVVRVHAVERDASAEELVLVTELCSGGSLEDRYETAPIQVKELRRLMTEAAIGMQVIHSRGMIHRDIKPGNILVGADGRAKMADFGLVTDDVVEGYASTAGYADHLAPEVWRGRGTDVQTDVWAFGMTVYRLLHGAGFYGDLDGNPREKIQGGGFARSLPFLSHVPDGWRRFVRKCMHDKQEHRFENFEAVSKKLGQIPDQPSWRCHYHEQNHITWERIKGSRELRVEWETHRRGKHEWSAVSHPAGDGGKKYTLASSDGVVNKGEGRDGLREFFEQDAAP